MAGTPLPARQDLDPIVLGAELLPCLSIIEVIESTNDYKWVLVGERIPGVVGTRLKDKYLSQIEKQVGEIVLFRNLLEQVTKEKKPLFYILRHRTTDGSRKRSYGVLLPLRDREREDDTPVAVASILSAGDATTGV